MNVDNLPLLLNELEQELQRLNLWDVTSPSAESLASSEPFCVDTLALNQWIQWIFIPRLRALIEGNLTLPSNCSILPIAEEFCGQQSSDCSQLLVIISKIDKCLS